MADCVFVEMTDKFLETFGTGTLTGHIAMENNFHMPKVVVLRFFETSLPWRKEHQGPRPIIINEYTIRCLLEDVLSLKGQGVRVNIELKIENPAVMD